MAFAKNVFVNCPFDRDYLPILQSIVFGVTYLGFNPRLASESLDSGQPRITKLFSLIEESKFAIHDLSRIQAVKAGEFFRLNMPFELGLDVGCRQFKEGKWRAKKCLILETQRYRFQAAISDISNSDIAAHGDNPLVALKHVRNWLAPSCVRRPPSPTAMQAKFEDFLDFNRTRLTSEGYSTTDIDELPIGEFVDCIREWIKSEGGA